MLQEAEKKNVTPCVLSFLFSSAFQINLAQVVVKTRHVEPGVTLDASLRGHSGAAPSTLSAVRESAQGLLSEAVE